MFRKQWCVFAVFFCVLAISSPRLYSQYYVSGSDPARSRWNIITTDHYKFIYPREMDSVARVYLRTLEAIRPAVLGSLGIEPKRIPVLLHPYTTMSNGLVSWAPKRIELYSSPDPYGSESDEWVRHLSIHELRHVGQISYMTEGVYNFFYYLLGEQVTGLGLGLFVGNYLLEGDAVMAETEFSMGGRGRNADFTRYARVMYINKDFRNWDKIRFGSNRYHTPNHYVLGYLLGSYVRYDSGVADLTGRVMSTFPRQWYRPGRLMDPLRHIVGTGKDEMFRRSQRALSDYWLQDYLSRGEFSQYSEIKKDGYDRLYEEYTNPIYIENSFSEFDGGVLVLREGMQTARKLEWIDAAGNGHFLRFFNPVSSRLTYDGQSRVYWSEPVTVGASEMEDFSVVMYYDILRQQVQRLTTRTKYFNPAPSEDVAEVAVAEYPVEGGTFLTMVSTVDGKPLRRYKAPEGWQIKEPVYSGGQVYCSMVTDSGGIGLYRCDEGQWVELLTPAHVSLTGLKSSGGSLYFTSDLDGVLNIYRYSLASGTLQRLTNSGYGADYPYFRKDGEMLYYCEYGPDGYRPVTADRQQQLGTPAKFESEYTYILAETITAQTADAGFDISQGDSEQLDAILDSGKYPSRKYNRLLHAFRIHSWFPAYVDVDRILDMSFERVSQVASLGATVLSQNTLGTLISSLSYGYVKDEYTGRYFHSGHITADAKIVGDLRLDLRLDVNERNTFTRVYNVATREQTTVENLRTPLLTASAMLYYPLSVNSRGWYRTVMPFALWSFSNDKYSMENLLDNRYPRETMVQQVHLGISYGQVIPTAKSQIFPRWGFGVTLRGLMPVAGNYFGNLVYANGYAYFPGFSRQQGLKVAFAAQKQLSEDCLFYTSIASLPRGYNDYNYAQTYLKLSLDYAVPVYLGDFSIGPLLYVKRLQLIPFVDYALDFKESVNTECYMSVGTDALLDFNILRFSFPFSVGVRYACAGFTDNLYRHSFSLLFNVSF